MRRSKKTSNFRVIGLCEGNSPVTEEFSSQMASNAENVSIWWRHHGIFTCSPVSQEITVDISTYSQNWGMLLITHARLQWRLRLGIIQHKLIKIINNPCLSVNITVFEKKGARCSPYKDTDRKVDGVSMGPTWGRQDPCGSHVGPMNLAIWEYKKTYSAYHYFMTYLKQWQMSHTYLVMIMR